MRTTAASSPSSSPTMRSGPACPTRSRTTSSSSPGGILHAHPPPRANCVNRCVVVTARASLRCLLGLVEVLKENAVPHPQRDHLAVELAYLMGLVGREHALQLLAAVRIGGQRCRDELREVGVEIHLRVRPILTRLPQLVRGHADSVARPVTLTLAGGGVCVLVG